MMKPPMNETPKISNGQGIQQNIIAITKNGGGHKIETKYGAHKIMTPKLIGRVTKCEGNFS